VGRRSVEQASTVEDLVDLSRSGTAAVPAADGVEKQVVAKVSATTAEARMQTLRRSRRANWPGLCLPSGVVEDANTKLRNALEAVSEC
jgi:hypothetical protein